MKVNHHVSKVRITTIRWDKNQTNVVWNGFSRLVWLVNYEQMENGAVCDVTGREELSSNHFYIIVKDFILSVPLLW